MVPIFVIHINMHSIKIATINYQAKESHKTMYPNTRRMQLTIFDYDD